MTDMTEADREAFEAEWRKSGFLFGENMKMCARFFQSALAHARGKQEPLGYIVPASMETLSFYPSTKLFADGLDGRLLPVYLAPPAESEELARLRVENERPTEALTHARGGSEPVETLFASARAEAEKAMRNFPQPNYVISKVAEEAGEVVKAAIHCAEGRETKEAVVGEIRQAMAMLIRLYVEGDQVHGLPPLLEVEAEDAAERAASSDGGAA